MTLSRSTVRLTTVLAALLSVCSLLLVGPARAATEQHGPHLVVLGRHDHGVAVSRPRQADRRLARTPRDFRRFVARTVRDLRAEGTCPAAYLGVTVNRVRSDDFARGSINECGGYLALWKRVDGRWREIYGTQDIWTCRVLRRNQVPAAVLRPDSRCYDGHDVVAYRHR